MSDTVLDVGHATLVDVMSGSSSSSPFLAEPDAQRYLERLTTLPLSTLLDEQPALATQAHHLTSSLTSLTYASYPTFLSLHAATQSLSDVLASLSSTTASMLSESLSALQATASAFRADAEPVLGERARARQVLEQHDKIRDLLDIPVLIDTCVRNGFFSEALSLAAHATSLSSAIASPPPIIHSIQNEVTLSLRTLLHTLLHMLYEPNRKLPALWKAVTFLRRMEVMAEDELALAFLIGRGECVSAALTTLGSIEQVEGDGESKARYLKKYVDVWREGTYDIIVQYTSIFLSSAPPSSPLNAKQRPPSAPPKNPVPLTRLRTLLATHAHHMLTILLLPTLRTHLPAVPTSAYPSLLTQLTYCATSFARVGFDFRAVVGGTVRGAVRGRVLGMLRDTERQWYARLKRERDEPPSRWLVTPSCVDSPPFPLPPNATAAPNVPPSALTSYPPLAELTNSLLETLNVLRLLAPLDIAVEVWEEQERVLRVCGSALLGYLKGVESSGESEAGERRVGVAVGKAYVDVLAPFMRRGLMEGVYGIQGEYTPTDEMDKDGQEIWKEWNEWLAQG